MIFHSFIFVNKILMEENNNFNFNNKKKTLKNQQSV